MPTTTSMQGFSRRLASNTYTETPSTHSELTAIFAWCERRNLPISPCGAMLSYGDAQFCTSGCTVSTIRLKSIEDFCPHTGTVVVGPGVTFRELFRFASQFGWMPIVSPGFSEITISGAIAMDVHGTNHSVAGGFSRCVIDIELQLTSEKIIVCSREKAPDLFYATIGGVGLTGFITRIKLQLIHCYRDHVQSRSMLLYGLPEILSALHDHRLDPYVVIWVDLLNASSVNNLRAVMIISRLSDSVSSSRSEDWKQKRRPSLQLLSWCYNGFTNRMFNHFFYLKHWINAGKHIDVDLRRHLFPWDGLATWNFLYGSKGFVENQFCLPGKDCLSWEYIFSKVIGQKIPVYMAAMKLVSEGEGLLSYGLKHGVSCLLDVPSSQRDIDKLIDLNNYIVGRGGRVHLAKDSILKWEQFQIMRGKEAGELRSIREKYGVYRELSNDMSRRLGIL